MFATIEFWAWVVSALLALFYLFAGITKGFRPLPDLNKMMPWTAESSAGLIRFIGYAEIAGALGLFLPILTGILSFLTPLAALGLAVIQVLAIPFHLRRNEGKVVPMNIVLLLLALFVLYARRGLLGL